MTVVAGPDGMAAREPPADERDQLALQLGDVCKQFRRPDGTIVPAIDGVDLDVHPGEFVVLLGPSGCGKTTLLRAIAGLERPDSGEITSYGATLYSSARGVEVPTERRALGMVFQSYALWPHLTVHGNVAYPMRYGRKLAGKGKPSKAQVQSEVRRALQTVGIEELADQFPAQISGGQQQRVALARAIVDGRDVILFDEPLSNVDARVREHLRSELRMMHRELGFTAVYVTHDQVEAMELADRIVVMQRGQVAQMGSPESIYGSPETLYVARFLGVANDMVADVVSATADRAVLTAPVGTIEAEGIGKRFEGTGVNVVMRPEYLSIEPLSDVAPNRWRGEVVSRSFLGAYTEYIVRLGDETVCCRHPRKDLADVGDDVSVSILPENVRLVPRDSV